MLGRAALFGVEQMHEGMLECGAEYEAANCSNNKDELDHAPVSSLDLSLHSLSGL